MEELGQNPEHPEAPESVLGAYREGNTRFPTFAFPFAVLMAEAALFDSNFDPVSLARSQLSTNQLKDLKFEIAAQHGHNVVPLAPSKHEDKVRERIAEITKRAPKNIDVETMPDALIQRQWHRHINHVIGIIGALTGVRKPPPRNALDELQSRFVYKPSPGGVDVDDKALISLAEEIARRLKDKDTLLQVQNALRSFAQALSKGSSYAKERSVKIRALKDRHASRPFNEELFDAIIAKYERDIMNYGYRRVLAKGEMQDFKTTFFHV